MKKSPKFIKGPVIRSLPMVVGAIEAELWLYLRDTPKHPGILRSMTLHTLGRFVQGGQIALAIPRRP